jgi:hypothetical protein
MYNGLIYNGGELMNSSNGSFQTGGYTPRELQDNIKVRKRRALKRLSSSNVKLGIGIIFLILIIVLFVYVVK